jgi:hypothetical protein
VLVKSVISPSGLCHCHLLLRLWTGEYFGLGSTVNNRFLYLNLQNGDAPAWTARRYRRLKVLIAFVGGFFLIGLAAIFQMLPIAKFEWLQMIFIIFVAIPLGVQIVT